MAIQKLSDGLNKLRGKAASTRDTLVLGNQMIRDFVYLDSGKTESLYSQLFGGLPREIHESNDLGGEGRAGIRSPIAAGDLRVHMSNSTTSILTLHHSMFGEVEEELFHQKVALDLNDAFAVDHADEASLEAALRDMKYVRVEGDCEFRIPKQAKRLTGQLAGLMPVIRQAAANSNSPVNSAEVMEAVPNLMDMVMPSQSRFAVQPFHYLANFKLYSKLKEDCFVDGDSESVDFHYGSWPSVRLTLFGLLSSTPLGDSTRASLFDMLSSQHSDENSLNIAAGLEQALEALEPLQQKEQTALYPSMTVLPLAIYRTIRRSRE